MITLSEQSLAEALQQIRRNLIDNAAMSIKPTHLVVAKKNLRLAQLVMQPWRKTRRFIIFAGEARND